MLDRFRQGSPTSVPYYHNMLISIILHKDLKFYLSRQNLCQIAIFFIKNNGNIMKTIHIRLFAILLQIPYNIP